MSVMRPCKVTPTCVITINLSSVITINRSDTRLAGKDMAFKDLPHSLEAVDVEGASQPQNPAEPVHKVLYVTCCLALPTCSCDAPQCT